jgi:hypothetical protein
LVVVRVNVAAVVRVNVAAVVEMQDAAIKSSVLGHVVEEHYCLSQCLAGIKALVSAEK